MFSYNNDTLSAATLPRVATMFANESILSIMNQVTCQGTEQNLFQCQHVAELVPQLCDLAVTVGVSCQSKSTTFNSRGHPYTFLNFALSIVEALLQQCS